MWCGFCMRRRRNVPPPCTLVFDSPSPLTDSCAFPSTPPHIYSTYPSFDNFFYIQEALDFMYLSPCRRVWGSGGWAVPAPPNPIHIYLLCTGVLFSVFSFCLFSGASVKLGVGAREGKRMEGAGGLFVFMFVFKIFSFYGT